MYLRRGGGYALPGWCVPLPDGGGAAEHAQDAAACVEQGRHSSTSALYIDFWKADTTTLTFENYIL